MVIADGGGGRDDQGVDIDGDLAGFRINHITHIGGGILLDDVATVVLNKGDGLAVVVQVNEDLARILTGGQREGRSPEVIVDLDRATQGRAKHNLLGSGDKQGVKGTEGIEVILAVTIGSKLGIGAT